MDNASSDDSGPLGKVRRDVAQLRSNHDKLRADHDDDHRELRKLQQADAGQIEILRRIEGKVDALAAVESRVRDLETGRAERRGRWWGVAAIATVVVTMITATLVSLLTDWTKHSPIVAPAGDQHRAPDGDPLPPWRH